MNAMSLAKEQIENLPNSVKNELHGFLKNPSNYSHLQRELELYDIILETEGYQVPIGSFDDLNNLKSHILDKVA